MLQRYRNFPTFASRILSNCEMLQFLKNIFQVIISPDRGWEDIGAEGKKAEIELMPKFLLLGAVASVTVFMSLLFGVRDVTFVQTAVGAVVVFLKFLIGYFLAVYVFINFMADYFTGGPNENKIRTFCIYSIAILMIFQILSNLIPHSLPIMSCLPFYLIVVVWKSMRYLLVDDSRTIPFVVISSLVLTLPPILLGLFANMI